MRRSLLFAMLLMVAATNAAAVVLSTTYIGEGAVNPAVGSHDYSWGSPVTLTATPAHGWLFDHWEGAFFSQSNPTQLRMWGHRRITAVFPATGRLAGEPTGPLRGKT